MKKGKGPLLLVIVIGLIGGGIVFGVQTMHKTGLYEGDYSNYDCTEFNCDKKADGGVRYYDGQIEKYYCKQHFHEHEVAERKYENKQKQGDKYHYQDKDGNWNEIDMNDYHQDSNGNWYYQK